MPKQRNNRLSPKDSVTFHFVNLNRPVDATQNHNRRRIKSHVSKWHYRKARERFRDNAAISTPTIGSGTGPQIGPPAHLACGRQLVDEVPLEVTATPADPNHRVEARNYGTPKSAELQNNAKAAVESGRAVRLLNTTTTKSFSQGAMSFETFALNDTNHIVGAALNAFGLDLSSVLVSIHRPETRAWADMTIESLPKNLRGAISGFHTAVRSCRCERR